MQHTKMCNSPFDNYESLKMFQIVSQFEEEYWDVYSEFLPDQEQISTDGYCRLSYDSSSQGEQQQNEQQKSQIKISDFIKPKM